MDKKKLFLESISRLNISKEKVTAVRSLLEECMEYSNHDETGANWKVQIWPGSGYTLGEFNVAASSDEEALEKVAAILTRDNQKAYYITQKEYDDMFSQELDVDPDYESDQYVYVDGTMEGASEPIYINAENLQVNPIGETESGKMESVDSASEVSDGINDASEGKYDDMSKLTGDWRKVAEYQNFLNDNGFNISVDGKWGPETERAYQALVTKITKKIVRIIVSHKNEPVEDSRNRAAESVNGQKASGEKAKILANRTWGDFFEQRYHANSAEPISQIGSKHHPIGETESGKMESVDSASEVSDGINDGTESDESQKPIDDPNSTVVDESMTIDQMWDALIDKGVTEQTLDLITSINGYSKDTLHDVLFAYTGYRDFEQANSDN